MRALAVFGPGPAVPDRWGYPGCTPDIRVTARGGTMPEASGWADFVFLAQPDPNGRGRIEIAVNNEFVKPTVDAIIAGARTGNIGDGKIFIVALEDCIRIRTGETGSAAIG